MSKQKPPIDLDSDALDLTISELEEYLFLCEEELGYFPSAELLTTLFLFATLIAKSYLLTEKQYLILAKSIYRDSTFDENKDLN